MENNTYVGNVPFEWDAGARSLREQPDVLSISLMVVYFILGIISFTRTLWIQCHRRGDSQTFPVFVVSLISNDFLHALSTIPVLILLSDGPCEPTVCMPLAILWFGSRRIGCLLSLLVALESFLPLSRPQWGARLRSIYVAVPVLFAVTAYWFILYYDLHAAVGMGAVTCALAVAAAASYVALPAPHSKATWARMIAGLAIIEFFLLFFPTFIMECLLLSGAYPTQYIELVFRLNWRLNLDGILCYFALEAPRAEEQQQGAENPNFSPSVHTDT